MEQYNNNDDNGISGHWHNKSQFYLHQYNNIIIIIILIILIIKDSEIQKQVGNNLKREQFMNDTAMYYHLTKLKYYCIYKEFIWIATFVLCYYLFIYHNKI